VTLPTVSCRCRWRRCWCASCVSLSVSLLLSSLLSLLLLLMMGCCSSLLLPGTEPPTSPQTAAAAAAAGTRGLVLPGLFPPSTGAYPLGDTEADRTLLLPPASITPPELLPPPVPLPPPLPTGPTGGFWIATMSFSGDNTPLPPPPPAAAAAAAAAVPERLLPDPGLACPTFKTPNTRSLNPTTGVPGSDGTPTPKLTLLLLLRWTKPWDLEGRKTLGLSGAGRVVWAGGAMLTPN